MGRLKNASIVVLVAFLAILQFGCIDVDQASAQEINSTESSSLKYDTVYGVRHGEYALMDKVVEDIEDNGETDLYHQIDLVSKDSKIITSLEYYLGDGAKSDVSPYGLFLTSFSLDWDYLIVPEDKTHKWNELNQYGIMTYDGTLAVDYQYDAVEFDGTAADFVVRGIMVGGDGEAYWHEYDSDLNLIRSFDLGVANEEADSDDGSAHPTEIGPYIYFDAGHGIGLVVFELTGEVYQPRRDISWIQDVGDGYWLMRSGDDLILENEVSSVRLDMTIGDSAIVNSPEWRAGLLPIMLEKMDGDCEFVYFDTTGKRVDESAAPGQIERKVTPIGDTGYNLVETATTSAGPDIKTQWDYTIESGADKVSTGLPVKLPDYQSIVPWNHYGVCGNYVYQGFTIDKKASIFDVFGNEVASFSVEPNESMPVRFVQSDILGGVFKAYTEDDFFEALFDTSPELISRDSRYDHLDSMGPWIDGEDAYRFSLCKRFQGVDDDRVYPVSYDARGEDFQPMVFQGYTLSYCNSGIMTYGANLCSYSDDFFHDYYAPANQFKRENADVYYVTNESGKYGAIDSSGSVVIPFEYEGYYDAGDADSNYILLKKNGQWEFYYITPDNPATQASVERLAGAETAYQTSAKISEEAFPNGSEWIVLARDDDFADAMSATGLAGALKAPIVLTDRFGLSTEAANEIKRLGAKSCYIIGGTAAMPGAFETQLKALGLTAVERVFGSESWDTSVACANKISLHGGNKAGDAIVAMSLKFRDALSISSFAYKYGVPIYLQTAEGDRPLPAAAISAISNLRGTIYVAGGNGAVRESTVEDVFGVDRVVRMAGTTGYDTSNQIATYMVNNGLLSADTVCVACGATAAHGSDALSGAALAGTRGGVMLMTNGNVAMEDVRTTTIDGCDSEGTPAFLSAHASEVSTAYLLGGTFVIPESLADRVEAILGV